MKKVLRHFGVGLYQKDLQNTIKLGSKRKPQKKWKKIAKTPLFFKIFQKIETTFQPKFDGILLRTYNKLKPKPKMSALLIDYNSKCECNECNEGCFLKRVDAARASEAKPDEFVVPLQWHNERFAITTCPHSAKREQANQDFVGIWKKWGKKQKEASHPDEYLHDMVSQPYSPKTPPGEWLENPDNFRLIRDYMFMSGSGPESDAANLILYGNDPDKIPLRGPFKGVFDKNDILLEELAIKKFIYSRYHFAFLNLGYLKECLDQLNMDYYYEFHNGNHDLEINF